MAWQTSTVLTVASLAATAASAGLSYYSSYQQSKAAQNAANYNYLLQSMQAKAARAQQMYQAAAMQQQAKINEAMAAAQAQAQLANARQIQNQAEAQAANQRDNLRKQRLEHERVRAIQRARIAGSGVVESGSPLEILAESAGEMEQQLNEMHYQADIERRQAYRAAELERFAGQMSMAGGIADASMLRVGADAEALKAQSQYRAGRLQANINRMAGLDQAKGYQMQAYGSLLSGVGGIADQWSSWRYQSRI